MEFAEYQHRRVVMHMQLCGILLWYPCAGESNFTFLASHDVKIVKIKVKI